MTQPPAGHRPTLTPPRLPRPPAPPAPPRRTADTINDNDLDQLYTDLARYEEVLAELNETLVHRAKHAAHTETVLREVLALFTPLATMRATGTVMAYSADEVVDAHRMTRWRAALDAPKEQPGPAVPAPASWLTAGTRDLNIPALPVPCPACARAEQAGLDPTEQHPNCRTQETR